MMYDVIISGAGIAGSFLASQLDPNLDVLILDRNKDVIPKDSGIVSTRFESILGKDARKLIKCEVNKMECISPSGLTFPLKSELPYAYILERKKFGEFLRKNAKKKADIAYDGVKEVTYSDDRVLVKTDSETHEAKLIIGCDGANSIVRKAAGIKGPNVAFGVMVKPRQKLEGDISVFFNKYFSPDFFTWIIPQNNEYGIMTCLRPKEYLDYFAESMYLPSGNMYGYMIPYTYTKSYARRTLLVGDSCGQNKPLTGGGIMFSMIAAQHAAIIINDAFREERFDENFLSYYERYWKKDMAKEIRKQYLLRRIYRKLTNNEIDMLFKDLGPVLSVLDGFDYDKLGAEWRKLPKLKLVKYILPKLLRLL